MNPAGHKATQRGRLLLTRRAGIMGPLVNRRLTAIAAACVTVLVVTLNVYLRYLTATGRG